MIEEGAPLVAPPAGRDETRINPEFKVVNATVQEWRRSHPYATDEVCVWLGICFVKP
jgi:hypothetical protein